MSFVYMAKNSNNELYIGVSDNPSQRIRNHNEKRGAGFTKIGGFKIVFIEKYPNLKEARKREIQIKKWRREKKEILIKRYQNNLPTKL